MNINILMVIVVVLLLFDELVIKRTKNREIVASIHHPNKLKKFKEKKNDEYINISKNINLSLEKKVTDNNLCLLAAAPGSGKTYSFILNNLLLNMNHNKIVTDVARSMIDKNYDGFILKDYYIDHGYDVKELDLYNFFGEDKYNPLHYVFDSNMFLIKNRELRYTEEINTDYIESLLKTFVYSEENDFWINAVRDNALTIILYMFYNKKYKDKRNFITVCNIFNQFLEVDKESNKYGVEEAVDHFELEISKIETDSSGLKHLVIDQSLPAYFVLERLKGFKNDIVMDGNYSQSIKGSFKSCVSDRILKSNVIRTIEKDTMNIDLILDQNKKTIWFLSIVDINQNYNYLLSMFYLTIFYMIDIKYRKNLNRDRSVIFYLDEFGSSIYIDKFETILSNIRKKDLKFKGGTIMFLVLQNFSQLTKKYGKEGAEEIIGDCKIKLYLGVDDEESKKKVSEWGGEKIVNLSSENRSSKSNTKGVSESFHPLVSINFLNQLQSKKHQCLLFINGKVYLDKMKPFVKMQEFKNYIKKKKKDE